MTITCVAVFGGSGFSAAHRQPVGGHGSNCPSGGAVTLTLGVELMCYHSLMHTVTYPATVFQPRSPAYH